ncbi:phage tail protein [Bordetella flabilis]|uniref:Phage tail protein n=1 Tax=Bordetella flabilis TaxID=463014 RepID=A0A193GI08_9BORD|nr:phage tail protein [Bordetella flabilis]ANN78909.1 phage tail protein [Bordetella flabilis]
METFAWKTIGQPVGTITLRTLSAQFGDGYKQDAADGINAKVQTWPIQCVGLTRSEANLIVAFFDRHAGYKAFQWTPPIGGPGLYKVVGYSPSPVGGGVYTISATFQQAFAA